MKLSKFTLGAMAGIATVALAVPFLAQISSAASTGTAAKRPVPTQQQVTDMAAKDAAFLSNIDALVTVEKSAVQAHQTALTAAAAITDDTQRAAAVKAANDAERAAIQAAHTANPNLKSAMMPFGGGRGGPGGPGMMGRGPNQADLASKLGMTETELKAALDSGKTVQELATEKGVTLPAPRKDGEGRGPDLAVIATKLGMTEADLKAALDSGKTVQQLATEKGVTLPAMMNGKGGKRGGGWMMGGFKKAAGTSSSTSSDQ